MRRTSTPVMRRIAMCPRAVAGWVLPTPTVRGPARRCPPRRIAGRSGPTTGCGRRTGLGARPRPEAAWSGKAGLRRPQHRGVGLAAGDLVGEQKLGPPRPPGPPPPIDPLRGGPFGGRGGAGGELGRLSGEPCRSYRPGGRQQRGSWSRWLARARRRPCHRDHVAVQGPRARGLDRLGAVAPDQTEEAVDRAHPGHGSGSSRIVRRRCRCSRRGSRRWRPAGPGPAGRRRSYRTPQDLPVTLGVGPAHHRGAHLDHAPASRTSSTRASRRRTCRVGCPMAWWGRTPRARPARPPCRDLRPWTGR
jgi:hypothetical protein